MAGEACRVGGRYEYWALVESYRTARGPRERVVAYLGDLRRRRAGLGDEPRIILEGIGQIHVADVILPTRHGPYRQSVALIAGVLAVAAAAAGEAAYQGFPPSLAVVPVSLLVLAAAIALGSLVLARRGGGVGGPHLLAQHRVAIASGLTLIGAAVTVVLRHLEAAS